MRRDGEGGRGEKGGGQTKSTGSVTQQPHRSSNPPPRPNPHRGAPPPGGSGQRAGCRPAVHGRPHMPPRRHTHARGSPHEQQNRHHERDEAEWWLVHRWWWWCAVQAGVGVLEFPAWCGCRWIAMSTDLYLSLVNPSSALPEFDRRQGWECAPPAPTSSRPAGSRWRHGMILRVGRAAGWVNGEAAPPVAGPLSERTTYHRDGAGRGRAGRGGVERGAGRGRFVLGEGRERVEGQTIGRTATLVDHPPQPQESTGAGQSARWRLGKTGWGPPAGNGWQAAVRQSNRGGASDRRPIRRAASRWGRQGYGLATASARATARRDDAVVCGGAPQPVGEWGGGGGVDGATDFGTLTGRPSPTPHPRPRRPSATSRAEQRNRSERQRKKEDAPRVPVVSASEPRPRRFRSRVQTSAALSSGIPFSPPYPIYQPPCT